MKDFPWWEDLAEKRKGGKPFRTPNREIWLERTGLPGLAILGLLFHLLVFWLLSFPYTYYERGICEVNCITITTGWDALGAILILPVFPYLACLLPILRKSARRKKWLETSLYLNTLINLGGFFLLWMTLLFSQLADLYNVSWRDAAYGIHLAVLLLVVVCSSVSSVLLGLLLRQSRTLG